MLTYSLQHRSVEIRDNFFGGFKHLWCEVSRTTEDGRCK